MLLVIDVGNSNIVLGVYDGTALVRNWRLSTDKSRTSDEYAVLLHSLFSQAGLGFASVKAAIISSVVPPLTGVMEAIVRDFFHHTPYVVGPGIKTGMPIQYDNPREVGADRIVNAVAGYEKHRCALVIVDFGTATTFDYVNAKGEYCGGAIAPGLAISVEALFQRASKLPRIDIVKPPHGNRQEHGQLHAGRHLLRLCRPGGRDRQPDQTGRQGEPHGSSPPADWPA